MITRDIITFGIQATRAKRCTGEDGSVFYETEVLTPVIEVMETSLTKTEARKALMSAGYEVPRNCDVIIEKLKTQKMAISLSDFIEHANVIG